MTEVILGGFVSTTALAALVRLLTITVGERWRDIALVLNEGAALSAWESEQRLLPLRYAA